jgi:TetR/AcrR family transcriptional regulator
MAATRNAELTQARLLAAAIECFARSGFDGVSLRSIERTASVERGLIAYHFSSKDRLWEAVVDHLFTSFADELIALRQALRDVSRQERARAMLLAFARFNTKQPEFFRLLVLEGNGRTSRSRHIADHLHRWKEIFQEILDSRSEDDTVDDEIYVYSLMGAAGMLFATTAYHAPDLEAQLRDPEVAERFAQYVAALFLGPVLGPGGSHHRLGGSTR